MNGGGIDCQGSSIISNNIITYNTSSAYGGYGGGVYCESIDYPSFFNNVISNNTGTKGGGLFFTSSSNATLSNNSICNNTATSYGGGIDCESSGIPNILNSTITNNNAADGGALYCAGSAIPVFRNCILWGNTASTGGDQVFLYDDGSDPKFYYCDVQGGSTAFDLNGNFYTGTYQNNINTDPAFVSPSAGIGSGYDGKAADWSLQNSSPCIDKGDPSYSPYPSTDLAANPRVKYCGLNIGAFEYQEGSPFIASINVIQPIICNGVTGGLDVVVSGGSAPFTYLWSNGQTTDSISGVSAGSYTVTVSDPSYSCMLIKSITLSQPMPAALYAGADTTLTCGGFAQLNAQPRWIKIDNTIPITSLNSVYFINSDTGYMAGNSGALYKTTDAGASWVQLTSGTSNNLNSVYFINTDIGFVAGTNGTILKTINGGITWTLQPSGSYTTNLHSVYFTNANIGYIFGDNGTILKTSNGGSNWNMQASGVSWNMNAAYFINPDTAYAVGDNGGVLKTTDGGVNWTQKLSTSLWYSSVWFTSADTGYVAGNGGNGFLLKTVDGGDNWSIQVNESGLNLRSIYFTSKTTGYAVGYNGLIMETTNGGNNWTKIVSVSTSFPLYSVYFTDIKTGYAVGSNSTILKLSIPYPIRGRLQLV